MSMLIKNLIKNKTDFVVKNKISLLKMEWFH